MREELVEVIALECINLLTEWEGGTGKYLTGSRGEPTD